MPRIWDNAPMMHYQVTCVCGQVFTINPSQLGAKVSCPKCHQLLMPTTDHAAPATSVAAVPLTPSTTTPTTETSADATTKRCPFCGETILAIAKKCKHCGEFLDHSHDHTGAPIANPQDVVLQPPVFALAVSQWDNFWKFLTTLIVGGLISAALLLVPMLKDYAAVGIPATIVFAGMFIYIFILAASRSRCYIRPTRIETETGILSKDLMSVDLFRVKDIELHQGVIQRLLRIGTIRVVSSDPDTPELMLYQIPQAKKVYQYLQQQVPIAVRQRGSTLVS